MSLDILSMYHLFLGLLAWLWTLAFTNVILKDKNENKIKLELTDMLMSYDFKTMSTMNQKYTLKYFEYFLDEISFHHVVFILAKTRFKGQ
jgi:hypothetical protein